MPSALADDCYHFAFIVELGRDLRADDWGAGAGQTGSKTRENCGIVRHNEAALDRMIDIIKTYADDLSGNQQRREQCDLVEIDGRSFLEHRYCPVECGAAFLDENIKRAGIACVSAQQAMELSIKASNCKPFPF